MTKISTLQSGLSAKADTVIENQWQQLKQFTSARIALGRAGSSLPTRESLTFQLDHAKAIDAVHTPLDIEKLLADLFASQSIGEQIPAQPNLVSSQASDRFVYLQRPDLGRKLTEVCWQQLVDFRAKQQTNFDLAIVLADGLSATAIQKHAVPFVENLVSLLAKDKLNTWSIAPITLASQGRVAIGDDIGECLQAQIVLVLIGERPGLTSPDSMGLYMTWQPKRGALESSRNCISNIRPEGLAYKEASQKAFYLLTESKKLKLSGINLKDRSSSDGENEALPEFTQSSQTSFILPNQNSG